MYEQQCAADILKTGTSRAEEARTDLRVVPRLRRLPRARHGLRQRARQAPTTEKNNPVDTAPDPIDDPSVHDIYGQYRTDHASHPIGRCSPERIPDEINEEDTLSMLSFMTMRTLKTKPSETPKRSEDYRRRRDCNDDEANTPTRTLKKISHPRRTKRVNAKARTKRPTKARPRPRSSPRRRRPTFKIKVGDRSTKSPSRT
jgi:hypothetical protein